MARFFAIDRLHYERLGREASVLFALAFLPYLAVTSLSAQTPMAMQSAPASGAASVPASIPPSPATATTRTPSPPQVPPAPVPDTFNRYGRIWAPSDDVAHPIKLNVQFPGLGEMNVPTQEELNQRDKLEQLAILSDDDIRAKLAEWPPFAKMKLADEGQLLIRIQAFKEQRTKIAMDKARDLGLFNSLTPDQKAKFEKEYWDKRLQMDHELAKQFEPIMKAREQKLRQDLFSEFSMPGTLVPAPAKPASIPVAQAKPGAPGTAPAAQNPVR